MNTNRNLSPYATSVTQEERSSIKGHKPAVLWFTGFSGSGKSTIANAVEQKLNGDMNIHTYLLDGDNIRSGLNKDLGFSNEGRTENIRRVGEAAKLMADAGLIVITAFISPLRADRDRNKELMKNNNFFEIFINCPIEVCMQRDPKGLYEKAKAGIIKEFTGISSPYEAPTESALVLNTAEDSVETCANAVLDLLRSNGVI